MSNSATVTPPPARSRNEDRPTPIPFPLPLDIRSLALTGLFLLAVFYTLYFARSFIVPLILVLLLDCLFSPLVRRLKRAHVPEALSAALVVTALVGTSSYAIYRLSGPTAQWIAKAPESLERAETKLRALRRPVEQMTKTAEQVEKIADMDGGRTLKVEIKGKSLGEVVFGGTQNLLGSALVIAILLYFTLASGDLFLTKMIKALPKLQDKKRAVQIARETEDQISSYLATITVINSLFGALVGAAMHLLGMPTPMLWGVLAGVTNFVPYLGAFACTIILGLVALVHFDTTGRALLVPGMFLVLNFLEGYVLTPMIVGRKLALNPVVVFGGVLFWGWIWGIVGALLAVPILATLKIVCDHIEGLGPIGEFLGQ